MFHAKSLIPALFGARGGGGRRTGPSSSSPPPPPRAAREAHAICVARLEQVRVLRRYRRRELTKRRDVVDHPEAPAMRGGNQIAVTNGEVVHRHRREIVLEPLPVGAVVRREPHATLR